MFTTALIEKVLRASGIRKEFAPGIISNVSIDSRSCRKNSFFFAFKGENVDGHDFIPALLEKGVLCAGEKDLPENDLYIKVPNVLDFLSALAKERRKLFKGTVFAITGSSGKTSTRQLTVSMLQLLSKSVHATSGNLNNHIGLPLVILNTPMNIDALVLEMGMNHAGEIRHLTEIADPDLSVITNIGTAHIGNFRSQKDLAFAKLEIFEYSKGIVVADTGNEFIKKWVGSNRSKRKIVEYSSSDSEKIAPEFDYLEKYMVENLYTASVTVKASEGIIPDLGKVVTNASFPSMRGEIRKVENRTFVVDCYNANPGSMRSSIENFYEKYSRKSGSETYLILGSMFELGEFSKKMHEELVNYLKNLNLLKRVFLIGCEFEKTRPGFLNEKKVLFLGDITDIPEHLPKEGVFLLKGSRGNRMEKIFDLLEKIGGVD
ncbi:MAG TPA: UDP-N-acetylmuramoyl-tripeptide--D-alanyl-D-alanine ligase [bacterium]|jgi:UDP-N-acetylmuramoyl-tripeptide--D-alanyl-D-alanine ligase|nr:UDP-N-acetylmuramoyl-tripeptide--D-alanyl-D-alanine ligase [bacterium]HNW16196.1 UDP-N-acetylmuramoyl-tripeptide--D-alanyl-D-alanine ligase [bacterium]HPM45453.1 UDP-N-acetylmuramoyl-tripeptide--D-alanyl-D-alanine ligase [bacterium]HPV20908.1 UDP-N-acetylmuramoyl-tripeptide--D-alanyl-D-alanine ligase [bacterium]